MTGQIYVTKHYRKMKKILFFLIFLYGIGLSGQSVFVKGVKIGDATKVQIDSISDNGGVLKIYSGASRITESDVIHDTIEAVRAAAVSIDDYLSDFEGGGSGYTRYDLSGKVDDTGFPATGDSLIINTGFVGRTILFFREGKLQQMHTDNTETDGYHFNQATGTLTVRPVFGAGEQLIVQAYEPVNVVGLVPEGGAGAGGSSGESTLLTDLLAFYKMDEVSGTVVNDVLGVNNGVTTATVNATGVFGKCFHFDTNTDDAYIPYSASMVPAGSTFTVSLWVKYDVLPVANDYLFTLKTTDAYYWTHILYVDVNGAVHFNVYNSSHTLYESYTANSAIAATDTWYHLTAIVDGANPLQIYVGDSEVSTTHPTFSGTFAAFTSTVNIGANPSSTTGTLKYMDDVGIWNKAVSSDEVEDLGDKTYPFN